MPLKSFKVQLDYMEYGYPTDAESMVVLKIAEFQDPIRFGNLFRNTRADVFARPVFLQLLRCAIVRNAGEAQPNAGWLRNTINSGGANSQVGEAGLHMPKKTYYIGSIQADSVDDTPTNRSWRVFFSDSLAEANGSFPGGESNEPFTDWDVAAANQPSPEIIKDMLPGIIFRRISGSFVNPPEFTQSALNGFKSQLEALTLEY